MQTFYCVGAPPRLFLESPKNTSRKNNQIAEYFGNQVNRILPKFLFSYQFAICNLSKE